MEFPILDRSNHLALRPALRWSLWPAVLRPRPLVRANRLRALRRAIRRRVPPPSCWLSHQESVSLERHGDGGETGNPRGCGCDKKKRILDSLVTAPTSEQCFVPHLLGANPGHISAYDAGDRVTHDPMYPKRGGCVLAGSRQMTRVYRCQGHHGCAWRRRCLKPIGFDTSHLHGKGPRLVGPFQVYG